MNISPQEQEKKPRRSTRAESEAVRLAADRRAIGKPLVVEGIGPGKLMRIAKGMFGKLDVDPGYQRGRVTPWINKLIQVLQAGGEIPDPVTLCVRPWDEDPQKLWIIDGWQRVCAFQSMGRDFNAIVHESESQHAERSLFLALNSKYSMSANSIVHAWDGPAGLIINKADSDPMHPLFNRVHFGQSGRRGKCDASTLCKGICTAVTGVRISGDIYQFLRRLDAELNRSSKTNVAVAEHYLRLVAHIFANDRPLYMPAIVIALIAHERWQHSITLPSSRVIERFHKLNWKAEVPSFNEKFLPVLMSLVRRIWK